MKQVPGFMLLELLVATVIAALIGTALFTSFGLINRYVVAVDDYTDETIRLATMYQQLEKDLSGAFIPVAARLEPEKPAAPAPAPQAQAVAGKTPEKEKPVEKKEVKPITHIFHGLNKDKNLDVLSFITDNSLQVYWSAHAGKPKPRVVRVVYRLVKDKDAKDVFSLVRQEGIELDFAAYKSDGAKKIRELPMIEGIKNLAVEFMVEQKENNEKKQSKEKQKKSYKTVKEWTVELKDKNKAATDTKADKDKKEEQLIPNGIIFKGALWDNQRKRDMPFEYKFMLNAEAESPKEAEPPAPTEAQKPQGPVNAWNLIANMPPHLRAMFQPPPGAVMPPPTQAQPPVQGMAQRAGNPVQPAAMPQNMMSPQGQNLAMMPPNTELMTGEQLAALLPPNTNLAQALDTIDKQGYIVIRESE